jgi:FkbM family methyltransferase
VLGYRRFLRLFAWFKVKTLRLDSREDDFFAFRALLPEDGLVLDIGANLGFLTAHLARHVKRGRVIAFEPMPDNLHALDNLVRTFDLRNVTIEPCAVGDRDGEVEMLLPVIGTARQQGLGHVVRGTTGVNGEGIRCAVASRRLDGIEYLFSGDAKVTGIKIDVEGDEQFVLAGAERIVFAHRPLIYLELGEPDNKRTCLELFERWGYEVMVNVNGAHQPYDPSVHAGRINYLARPLAVSSPEPRGAGR